MIRDAMSGNHEQRSLQILIQKDMEIKELKEKLDQFMEQFKDLEQREMDLEKREKQQSNENKKLELYMKELARQKK